MASLFASDLFGASAWDLLSTNLGETATITPYGGSPASAAVTVVLSPVDRSVAVDFDSRQQLGQRVVTVQRGALVGWTPSIRDTVTVSSVVYAVLEVLQDEGPVHRLLVERRDVQRIGPSIAYVGR